MTKLIPNSIYPFRAESTIEGWPGSGFTRRITDIRVRRVDRDGKEQVQIEICIDEFKGKGNRMYTHNGAITLDGVQASFLIDALREVKVYK
jgi:hypothetical protein